MFLHKMKRIREKEENGKITRRLDLCGGKPQLCKTQKITALILPSKNNIPVNHFVRLLRLDLSSLPSYYPK